MTSTKDFPDSERILAALKEARRQLAMAKQTEPIAIIGMSCRTPGAINLTQFWSLLQNGQDAIREVPPERWPIDSFYSETPKTPNKMNSRFGGFLENIDQFDAEFFNISPREARQMDPQQRLLLEASWFALEDAGQAANQLAGSKTGVFVGIFNSDYNIQQMVQNSASSPDDYWSTGSALSIASNRISYFYDFQGPSISLDTACSSSLVAIHLACQSLQSGESTLALAGGVNLILSPWININFSQGGGLSPDGRCKSFDANADGLVRSEGVGMVVLKSLRAAIEDKDPVYAVIHGSAINQDGHSNGLVAPNPTAQVKVIQAALQGANIQPADVGYIEAHGTGTALGDPIEIQALSKVYDTSERTTPLIVGSAKSNIGHTETASGVLGLIKTALIIKNRQVPASLHFKQPNRNLDFSKLNVRVPTQNETWADSESAQHAGVSAFGFGGTNAHLIIGQAPADELIVKHPETVKVLALSAHSNEALDEMLVQYRQHLESENPFKNDLIASTTLHRQYHQYRLATPFSTVSELTKKLQTAQEFRKSDKSTFPQYKEPSSPIVFVFSGNRATEWQYGTELFQQSVVFRNAIQACDLVLQKFTDWSIQDLLREEKVIPANDLTKAHCTLFAIQVAQATLWQSFNIQPMAVVGHSVGEIAAAHVASVLSLHDAIKLVYERSKLLEQQAETTPHPSAMLVVELEKNELNSLLKPFENRLTISAYNSPSSHVISGAESVLQKLTEQLKENNIFHRAFAISGAAHQSGLISISSQLFDICQTLEFRMPSMYWVSTLTGKAISSAEECQAEYWTEQLIQPVQFSKAIQTLIEQGFKEMLEVGPYPPILRPALIQNLALPESNLRLTIYPTLKRSPNEFSQFLESAADLYKAGFNISWETLWPYRTNFQPPPPYPFQRKSFWHADKQHSEVIHADNNTLINGADTLLGGKVYAALPDNFHLWNMVLDLDATPYLKDHQVQGEVIISTTDYLALASAGLNQILEQSDVREAIKIVDLKLDRPIFIPRSGVPKTTQVRLNKATHNVYQFEVLTQENQDDAWQVNASATIKIETSSSKVFETENLENQVSDFEKTISSKSLYQLFAEHGVDYGSAFRGVESIWWDSIKKIAVGKINVPAGLDSTPGHLHPVVMDACAQVLAGAVQDFSRAIRQKNLYLPVGIHSFEQFKTNTTRNTQTTLWSRVRFKQPVDFSADQISGNVEIFDEHFHLIALIEGLTLQKADTRLLPKNREQAYQPVWIEKENKTSKVNTSQHILFFADESTPVKSLSEIFAQIGWQVSWIFCKTQTTSSGDIYNIQANQLDDFEKLFIETIGHSPETEWHVVYSWQEQSSRTILNLVKGLANFSQQLRITFLTTNSQPVVAADTVSNLNAATYWTLANVIQFEQPNLQCQAIDLDDANFKKPSLLWVQELERISDEDEIGFRNNKRYIRRLHKIAIETSESSPMINSSSLYLIIGGTRGVGLALLDWLVQQGAQNLMVVARTAPDQSTQVKFQELKKAGIQITFIQLDISHEDQVRRLFEQIKKSPFLLKGLFHSAAIVDADLLINLTPERLDKVMAPKVRGSWYLHQFSLAHDLDYFVMFSSIASLLGTPGQGNYAVANAYQDALAHYRAALGQPALSINWTGWQEIGLLSRANVDSLFSLRGFPPITPEAGFEWLSRLLATKKPPTQVGIMDVNWPLVAQSFPQLQHKAFYEDVLPKRSGAQDLTDLPTRQKLATLNEAEGKVFIDNYLRKQLVLALGIDEASIDPEKSIMQYGLDSLMALEIKNRIEIECGVGIPIVKFLEGPTLINLTSLLEEQLTNKVPVEKVEPTISESQEPSAGELLSDLDSIDDTQVELLLKKMMEKDSSNES